MPLAVLLLISLFAALAGKATEPAPRVFLISLDGLGYEAATQDPAASELKTLTRLAAEGFYAPMQTSFPSLTAASHASMWTGVYGDKNGVTSNSFPLSPRSLHRFTERGPGFRGESLKAEAFWVKAGRQGIRSVAHNPTQGYPCTPFNSGPGAVVLNGYQTAELAPERLLKGSDVQWLPSPPPGLAVPKSRKPPLFFAYTSGRIRFVASVFAKGATYDTIRFSAYSGQRYVDASLKDAEELPLRNEANSRPLARYFSEALPVAGLAALHFRLFELAADGKDFLLFQTAAKQLSACQDGPTQNEAFKKQLLSTAGAFIGNGAGGLYWKGSLGPKLTNGLAERRFLETLELHARQTMRHTRALLDEFNPRLLVDYISTADDMLHLWWGLTMQKNAFIEPFRRWGYQIIDWRVRELHTLLSAEDHLIVVSDHGMSAMTKEFHLNGLLKEWGYEGRLTAQDTFLVVNTTDWLDGKVPLEEKKPLLEEVKAKLAAYLDPATQTPVFADFFWPDEIQSRYGVGGPNGGDLYFDLQPGYYQSNRSESPVLQALDPPTGAHGPLPTRPDLLALFLAHGPHLNSRPARMRSVDVAPLVLKLLSIP
jgi:hypothetical protein